MDPLKQHADADLVSKASIITNVTLEKKFGYSKGCSIASMPHFLQKDAVGCGVLSCYNASQIAKGNVIVFVLFKFFLIVHDNVRKTVPLNLHS